MPVKWKIFLALNFLLGIPCVAIEIFLVSEFFSMDTYRGDMFVFFLVLLSIFLIIVNCFLNVFILQRFYPDKFISRPTRNINIVSLLLNILIMIGILLVAILGTIEEFGGEQKYKDNSGRIAVFILYFFFLIHLSILLMQGWLPGIIVRNHHMKMDTLIESIGQ